MKEVSRVMELLPKFSYTLEIVLGELAFLLSFPRRKGFPYRLAASLAMAITCGYIMFNMRGGGDVGRFFQLLTILCVSIACMSFPFKGTWLAITSACTAGIAIQHIGYHLSVILALIPSMGLTGVRLEIICCLTLCLICFAACQVNGTGRRLCDMKEPWILFTSLTIVLLCIGVTRFVRSGGPTVPVITFTISFYAIICCTLALFIQLFLHQYFFLRNEKMMLERLGEERRKQYETGIEAQEQLMLMYHDLKHKLVALEGRLPPEEIASMQDLIAVCDSTYKTGLDALDVVLNQKNTHCLQRGIAFTCMGSGESLRFMDTMDLYSLFGNILDNAITAVEKLEKPEERAISVVIEKKGAFVSISSINFFNGGDLDFHDGIPVTSQTGETGFHGYGLKSVRSIAEKYQGGLSITVAGGLFRLSVYMMDPSESE